MMLLNRFNQSEIRKWERFRNLEFTIYNTAISMNGKKYYNKIKKAQDLYPLGNDPQEEVLSDDEAIEFFKTLV